MIPPRNTPPMIDLIAALDVAGGGSEADETLPTFHKARLKPLDWQVDCPVCGNVILVDVCENNDASWHADNGDQFPECDECGSHIEVTPVQVWDFTP